jgi:hypothetical protein
MLCLSDLLSLGGQQNEQQKNLSLPSPELLESDYSIDSSLQPHHKLSGQGASCFEQEWGLRAR